MEKIKLIYEEQCITPSDINEHLPTLLKYAKECEHITEMGVRWVSSTWPLLLSNPKKMISYDIVRQPEINEVIDLANENSINYTFIEADVLNIEIEKTDLLFIDTLHTYNQLIKELNIHSKNAKKYIILHDTTTFGKVDERVYDHASQLVINESTNKQGLWTALMDFLETEEGKKWEVLEKHTNNNGLTILKRK